MSVLVVSPAPGWPSSLGPLRYHLCQPSCLSIILHCSRPGAHLEIFGPADLHYMLCVESQVRDHFLSPRFPIVEPIFNMSTSVHLSVHTFPLWLEVTCLVTGSLSHSLCQTELSELIFSLGRSICVDVSNLDDISPSYCSPTGPLI